MNLEQLSDQEQENRISLKELDMNVTMGRNEVPRINMVGNNGK